MQTCNIETCEQMKSQLKSSIVWDIMPYSPLKANRSFNRLHGAISQKKGHLITTAVRTSVSCYLHILIREASVHDTFLASARGDC
jgi:hypothetical protein